MQRIVPALVAPAACAVLYLHARTYVASESAQPHTHAYAAGTAGAPGAAGNAGSAGKCPVDHKAMAAAKAAAPVAPVSAGVPSSASACPVVHTSTHTHTHTSAGTPADGKCPVMHDAPAAPVSATHAAAPGACPVNHGSAGAASGSASKPAGAGREGRGTVYNVYAQPIDPKNNMPAVANQNPSPGQQSELSTTRVQSNIPKGGTESTWLYPSPQMFWNALVRKNKADGVREEDIEMVVRIHNEMNERTWRALEQWENMHKSEHLPGEPSLRRFMGKPYELSFKAKVKRFFGYGLPFDRHDWFVDRNGKEVRYIIDYYFNADAGADVADRGVGLLEPVHTKGIHVDVRPALDDFAAVLDRLRLFPARAIAGIKRPRWRAEGLDPATAPLEAAAFALSAPSAPQQAHADERAPAPAAAPQIEADPELIAMHTKCNPVLERLKAAKEEDERRSAHVALNYCMASVLCPTQASAFMAILERNAKTGSDGEAGGEEERAFAAMTQCVMDTMQARRAAEKAK